MTPLGSIRDLPWTRLLAVALLGLGLRRSAATAGLEGLLPAGEARGAPAAASTTGPVAAALNRALVDLIACPERMLEVVPLTLAAEERAGIARTLTRLFRPGRIELLSIGRAEPSGRVGPVTLRMRNLDAEGIRVDTFTLTLGEHRVDPRELLARGRIVLVGDCPTRIDALVLEEDANRAQKEFRIEVGPGSFTVSGRAGVAFLKPTFRIRGELVAAARNTILYRPRSLQYGVVPIPRVVVSSVMQRVNPVFDLDRFLGRSRARLDLGFRAIALDLRKLTVTLDGTIRGAPGTAGTR